MVREPSKMQTSHRVGALNASTLSASRFANSRFDVLGLALSKPPTYAPRRNPLLPVPPYLNPFLLFRSHTARCPLPSSLRGACWPLPSRGGRRIQNLGRLTMYDTPTRASPVPRSIFANLKMTPRQLCADVCFFISDSAQRSSY